MTQYLPQLALLAIAALLIGSNVSRFATAEPKIAMSEHLNFLPEPEVARALCLGHRNSVAKIRWIDSFKYFQYQIDHGSDKKFGRDPRLGFEKLYTLLIGLDNQFQNYYQHASLTLSGIMGSHEKALRFLVMGTENIPSKTIMWANLLSHLKVYFNLEETLPGTLESLLQAWADAMPTPDLRFAPDQWQASLARRLPRQLSQIDYWLARMSQSQAGNVEDRLIQNILLEQVTRWHISLLEAYLKAKDSTIITGLHINPLEWPTLARGPLGLINDAGIITADPYGLPYIVDHSKVISLGLERERGNRWFATGNRNWFASQFPTQLQPELDNENTWRLRYTGKEQPAWDFRKRFNLPK